MEFFFFLVFYFLNYFVTKKKGFAGMGGSEPLDYNDFRVFGL